MIMAPLPDDVLLVVISHTDIDTFLSCRSLNRKVHDLILTHIHGLTEAVARSTFPTQTRILMRQGNKQSAGAPEYIRWLKGLRYEQLAALLLECAEKHSVAAEDPLGDDLRSHVARGWEILEQVAQIARDTSSLPVEELTRRELSHTSHIQEGQALDDDYTRLRELETCARQLAYTQTLSFSDLHSYRYLRGHLLPLFGFRDSNHNEKGKGNPLRNAWVFSYITKMGAEPFWQLWWARKPSSDDNGKTVNDVIEAACRLKDKDMRQFERHSVDTIQYQIYKVVTKIRRSITGATLPRDIPSEIKMVLHGPTAQRISWERSKLTEEGDPSPPHVLGVVSLEQRLAEDVIGQAPERKVDSRDLRRGSSRCCQDNGVREPAVLPEYKELYRQWYQQWREGRSWEKQVAELREKAERLAISSLTAT